MDVVEIVDRFYTPPLCLFGAIGNCLSVYVFCMTSGHRNLSSSYYLSALAISDIGFLINLFAVWLTGEGYEVITTRLTCPLIMYLGQVTCFLSVWFIVAFTCERFCAVCYPLTRPTVCTVARAKKVIALITLVALVAFSYVWVIAAVIPLTIDLDVNSDNEDEIAADWPSKDGVTTEIQNGSIIPPGPNPNRSYTQFVCSVPDEFHEFSMMANHLDSIFTLILPFFAITFLNCRITCCVWKFKGQRETIVATSSNLHARSNSITSTDKTRVTIGPIIRNGGGATQNGNDFGSGICSSCTPGSHKSRRQLPGTTQDGQKKRQGQGSGQGSSSSPPPPGGCTSKNVASSAAEVRVTKTLLLVSTVFLVLNLPSHAIRAFGFIQRDLLGTTSEEPTSYIFLFQQWANILFNTNFSVNFLLYCVSGRNFRKSLRNLCIKDIRKGGLGIGGHKRMGAKPFSKGLSPLSKKSKGNHGGKNPEMDLSEVKLEGMKTENVGKHSNSVHYHPNRPKSREMSFYPSSQTEVETYYA